MNIVSYFLSVLYGVLFCFWRLIEILAPLCVVVCGAAIVYKWIESLKNRKTRLAAEKNDRTRQAIYEEEKRDILRLNGWHARYPYGPTDSKGRTELKQLIKDRIGSYIKACNARCYPVNEEVIRQLERKIPKDWGA